MQLGRKFHLQIHGCSITDDPGTGGSGASKIEKMPKSAPHSGKFCYLRPIDISQ